MNVWMVMVARGRSWPYSNRMAARLALEVHKEFGGNDMGLRIAG